MENNVVLNGTGIIDTKIDGTGFFKEISSIFRGIVLAVKVSVLLALSIIYSVVALTLVILYMIFFKRIFEILIKKVRQRKHKSPYYYKWKKHHLDLNWEA